MDAYLAYRYLLDNDMIQTKYISTIDDANGSLRRNLETCTACGVDNCGNLPYECDGFCTNVSCDEYDRQRQRVMIGTIIAAIVYLFLLCTCVYFWAKSNARKRVVYGSAGGAMDEGIELCLVIILGILLGGLIGTLFFLLALYLGRRSGVAEGHRQNAMAGGTGGPVVQGYPVKQ